MGAPERQHRRGTLDRLAAAGLDPGAFEQGGDGFKVACVHQLGIAVEEVGDGGGAAHG